MAKNEYKNMTRKEYMKKYYENNKERIIGRRKKYYENNKERIIGRRKKYYKNNKEKCIDINKKWRENNKERHYELNKRWKENNKERWIELQKTWRNKNLIHSREWSNNYHKNRRKNDLRFKLRCCLRYLLYHALESYTKNGKITSHKKYGINWNNVIKYLIKIKPIDFDEWNEQNPNNIYSIDHIKPLVSFDLENKKEIKNAFAPENHQWLKLRDNMSKGDKYEYE